MACPFHLCQSNVPAPEAHAAAGAEDLAMLVQVMGASRETVNPDRVRL